MKNKQDDSDSGIIAQAKVTKGKARFYSYKRKLQPFFEKNSNIRATKEGRSVLDECFNGMKEAIALLGMGLDSNILDDEGSKLLDWAMIDCLSTTNQLDQCNRCFLCRQKQKLRRSHVWPNFIAQLSDETFAANEKEFIFGLDKHMFKSAGQCTYWMLCGRCEQLLSQNGENDFRTKFPTSGEVAYSSWLFSFCAGVVFRTLGLAIQFPMHYNDSDIHKVLLHCREHLLSLPVSTSDKLVSLCDSNKRCIDHLAKKLQGNLDIHLFMSPQQTHQDFGVFQAPYATSAVALSRNKLLNSRLSNFNGSAHFLLVCCGPVTLVVNFDQPVLSLKGGFRLTSKAVDSDEKYTIPSYRDTAHGCLVYNGAVD
jgi:hypothetical protein